MRILTLSLLSTLLLAGTASANDVYERSYENGMSVYRGVTVHPDVAAIQARAAQKAQMDAYRAEQSRRAEAARAQTEQLERQADAIEELTRAVEAMSHGRRGADYGPFYGYGYNGRFNGIFTDSFPQTRGRIRLNAPGALRPRVVRGQVRY